MCKDLILFILFGFLVCLCYRGFASFFFLGLLFFFEVMTIICIVYEDISGGWVVNLGGII